MDEDNRSEPAVRDVDSMTWDDITTTVTQLANSISSSKSEDDELERTTRLMESKETQLRLEGHMEDIRAAYDDYEFKLRFRISRSTFEYIYGIIIPKMKTSRPLRIHLKKQLLITLSLMTTFDSINSVSKRFNVSRTGSRICMRNIVKVLLDLAPSIITWPSGNNVNVIRDGFKNMSGFLNVIGVVDSICIIIPSSGDHPNVFYEQHRNEHSIQLQAVCDHNGRFVHCFTECPGSMTCQEVLQSSKLLEWLGNGKFPPNCYILGDVTYKLHKNLLVPYHVNGHLTPKCQNFNSCHARAREIIKRAFGLLKTRFCSIGNGLAIRKLDSISNFVTACCVIHNICLSNGDQIEYCLIDDAAENTPFHQDTESPEAFNRDSICDMLPRCNIWYA